MPETDGRVCLSLLLKDCANRCRLGLTKTGQGARIEGIARGSIGLIVPGKSFGLLNGPFLTRCRWF